MSFFLRYVVVYVLCAAVLLGAAVYFGFADGFGHATWIAFVAFGAWIFLYHPVIAWRDYRRVRRLIDELRAGKLDRRIDPQRLRESIVYVSSTYGGVPEIVASLVVRRVVTDDLARQIVARINEQTRRVS